MLIIPNADEIEAALDLIKAVQAEMRILYARAKVAYQDLNDPGGLAKVNESSLKILDRLQQLQEHYCGLLEKIEQADLNGLNLYGLAKLEEKDVYLHQLITEKRTNHNERQRT